MIEELRLRNFLGFRSTTIKFTKGLNLITGRNSAGKTALLEAIIYGLYGTVPGMERRQYLLVSRTPGAREMEVRLKLIAPKTNSRVEIIRAGEVRKSRFTSKIHRLIVDGREVQLESLEDLRRKITQYMGIGYRSFLWTVYAAQGKLTDILEPSRSEMDSVLEINLVREIGHELDEARRRILRYGGVDVSTEYKNLVNSIIPLKRKLLERIKREIDSHEKELEEIDERIKLYSGRTHKTLLQKSREYVELGSRVRDAERELRELLSEYGLRSLGELEPKISELEESLRRMEDELSRSEAEVREVEQEIAGYVAELRNLKKHYENHLKLLSSGESTCPTCGQPIQPDRMALIVEEEEARIKDLEERLAKARRLGSELSSRRDRVRRERELAQSRLTRLKTLRSELERRESRIKSRKQVLKSLRTELEGLLKPFGLTPDDPKLVEKLAGMLIPPEEIEAMKNRRKNIESRIKELNREKRQLEEEIKNLEGKVNELRLRMRAAELVEEVKDKVEEAVEHGREEMLNSISLRALSIFRSLTDQRVYKRIWIDRENYRVFVEPVGLSGLIPASRVGGGHQTLIALSIRLSILQYLGYNDLIILDEPTYGLDEENLQNLLNQMGRITRHIRQAIIVTHHGHGVEEADNIIEVYRDEDGFSNVRLIQ